MTAVRQILRFARPGAGFDPEAPACGLFFGNFSQN
jgi:hypothetical protein